MRCGSVCGRESARITLRKKKHPEPPLSHILAYPMAANMAGSGAQRNGSTRVSASVGSERMGDCGGERGERYGYACALTIAGRLPCRRTSRSEWYE